MEHNPGPVEFKVLVAEDNEVNQKVIRIILERSGCAFELANDGDEALRKFQSGKFDLILMDCQMPNRDGLQTTREIRAIELQSNLKRCPIVAMTANAMKGDRDKCIEAGMDDFLSKPFKSQELMQLLKNWSDNPKVNQESK